MTEKHQNEPLIAQGLPVSDDQIRADLANSSQSEHQFDDGKILMRKTGIRWLMLVCGCFFLMGSYFCYDNPAPLKSTLEEPPYNLSDTQWAGLYTIYSFPNMVLPLFGGILVDKLGVRVGLVLFTVVLTIGQLVFAIGGYQESYLIMMIGRFIFGLGGESMTVAQSSIVAAWFQGKELSFAFGINLSVARVGSSINGPVETIVADNSSVGNALMLGFIICLFSLVMAFLLVYIDWWAEKKDGIQVELSEEDKFKFSDLKQFNRLPYWLVTMSCVTLYMVIFIYIQFAPDMLHERFGFTTVEAGTFYTVPYLLSAVLSPILGFTIDKIGKRALFIMTSSVLILMACVITTLIPARVENDDPQYLTLIPLCLLGVGYSVYAAALWGSIPYTVPPKLVGTAYGLCTAVQNVGLAISPLIGSACLKTEKQGGYFWLMMYFCALACMGIIFNVCLYFDDLKNRDGILDRVDDGESLQELITTPVPEENRKKMQEHFNTVDDDADMLAVDDDDKVRQDLQAYKNNKGARDNLKRSIGRSAGAQ